MATFLFDDFIFGPVKSRRLGSSLGINLLPRDCKFCNFDCIYCECGWTPELKSLDIHFPDKNTIAEELEKKLLFLAEQGDNPDVITFAGNGEPTLHPEFPEIVEETIHLRNRITPLSKVAVLSNATMLHKKRVFDSLLRVDDNIQKLDAAEKRLFGLINKPVGKYSPENIVLQLQRFNGKVIIQSLFLKAMIDGILVDNSSDSSVAEWIEALTKINPEKVLIYSYSRDTPHRELWEVEKDKLAEIALKVKHVGIAAEIF